MIKHSYLEGSLDLKCHYKSNKCDCWKDEGVSYHPQFLVPVNTRNSWQSKKGIMIEKDTIGCIPISGRICDPSVLEKYLGNYYGKVSVTNGNCLLKDEGNGFVLFTGKYEELHPISESFEMEYSSNSDVKKNLPWKLHNLPMYFFEQHNFVKLKELFGESVYVSYQLRNIASLLKGNDNVLVYSYIKESKDKLYKRMFFDIPGGKREFCETSWDSVCKDVQNKFGATIKNTTKNGKKFDFVVESSSSSQSLEVPFYHSKSFERDSVNTFYVVKVDSNKLIKRNSSMRAIEAFEEEKVCSNNEFYLNPNTLQKCFSYRFDIDTSSCCNEEKCTYIYDS